MKTNKKQSLYIVLAGILILVLAGCSNGSSPISGGKPQELTSELSREDMTEFPLGDLADLADGNSAFAVDLSSRWLEHLLYCASDNVAPACDAFTTPKGEVFRGCGAGFSD